MCNCKCNKESCKTDSYPGLRLEKGQRTCPRCKSDWDGGSIIDTFIEQRNEGADIWKGKTDQEIKEYVEGWSEEKINKFISEIENEELKTEAELLKENPDNWSIPYIAGINAYLYWHDEAKAAKYYRMAARFPEAPRWLAGQAKILESGIPSIVKKIRTWDAIYRSNEPEKVRNRAKEQLIALWLAVFNSNAGKQIKERARQALIDLDYQVN